MKKNPVLLRIDPSLQQAEVLDYVLQNDSLPKVSPEPRVSVSQARAGKTQAEIVSNRTTTRILYISQDTSLLNQTTESLDRYLNVADVFDEVHIIVLKPGIRTKNPVLRVAENVWVYVAAAPVAWRVPFVALRIIEEHLVFAGGFRADLIVARDGYESALTAYLAGRRYNRPRQLHLLEEIIPAVSNHSSLWRHLSVWLVSTFASIRTTTQQRTDELKVQYQHTLDIEPLPQFRNFTGLTKADPDINLKNIYRQFSFMIIYVGKLTFGHQAFQAIDAARVLLRNPRVGLLIIGEGRGRAECIKRAELLGIAHQVIFEKNVSGVKAYIAAADVVVVPDVDLTSDDVVMQAAALGTPLVVARTVIRTDIFTNGESALFFERGDITTATAQLQRVLNDNSLRRSLKTASLALAGEQLQDDPVSYQGLYRDSIEQALCA